MTEGGGPRPPDGTRRERPTAPPDETRREAPSPSDATLPESSAHPDATRGEEAPPAVAGAGPPSATGFPQELAARFRPVRELDHGNQADVWLVEDDAGVPHVAKVYRPGFEGRQDILEILSGLEPNRDIVPVVSHGRAGGRLYVVLEYVPGGNLRELMQPGAPAPNELVREVLAQLVAALERLHGAGIEHHDLKPGNVLVRSRQPLDLVLADFGIATQASATVRATRLAGMTWAYAPPEAFSMNRDDLVLWRHKYDAWSLGIVVVELLTGRNPLPGTDTAIATFFVTRSTDDLVAGVADPAWRKLCRGLLRRDPEARWGTAETRRWLDAPDAPELNVKDEVAPAPPSAAPASGFLFVGRNYATAADLGSAMAGDWDSAADIWRNRNPELVYWLRHELGSPQAAARLEEIDRAADMGLDAQLFWAIRALAPQSPPSFQGQSLATEDLARIASRAAARPDGDDARLLRAVGGIPPLGDAGDSALTAQITRWSGSAPAWESLLEVNAELPLLSETDRVILLASATEGSGVTEQLRERTSKVLEEWPQAGNTDWFRRLGHVRHAEGPQLLAMALLARQAHEAAEAEARAKREKTEAEARAKREKTEAEARAKREKTEAEARARRKTRWLAIGAGATSGLVFSLICLVFKAMMVDYEIWVQFWDDSLDFVWPTMGGLGLLAGGVAIFIWVFGFVLDRRSWGRWFYLLCSFPLGLAVFYLTLILVYGLFGSAMILSYTIPGPFFLAPGFVLAICIALGIGLGMALDFLNLKATMGTFFLAALAVPLCIILVCAAIGAARFPGWHRGLISPDDFPPGEAKVWNDDDGRGYFVMRNGERVYVEAIGGVRVPYPHTEWYRGVFGDFPPGEERVWHLAGKYYVMRNGEAVELEAPVSE